MQLANSNNLFSRPSSLKHPFQHGLLSTNNQTFQARWVQGVVQANDVSRRF